MVDKSKVFTITTQLHTQNNQELCTYVDEYLSYYSSPQRVLNSY